MGGGGELNGTRSVDGRPDGVPLGRAFLIDPGMANEPLREAVDVVARVHGDGELPAIPIVWDSSLNVRARFVIRDGLPSAIAAKPGAAGLGIGLIHEIGHFLDFAALDRFARFASDSSPRTGRWLAAVTQTSAYRALSATIDLVKAGQLRSTPAEWEWIATLRSAEELWARTYTQYVVRRSAQSDLIEALASDLVGTVAGVEFPLHWNEDEFEPIDQEIERLFRRLRWRRR